MGRKSRFHRFIPNRELRSYPKFTIDNVFAFNCLDFCVSDCKRRWSGQHFLSATAFAETGGAVEASKRFKGLSVPGGKANGVR
jgi:hypothetical protein